MQDSVERKRGGGGRTDSSLAGKDEGEEVVAIINDDIFGALYRV